MNAETCEGGNPWSPDCPDNTPRKIGSLMCALMRSAPEARIHLMTVGALSAAFNGLLKFPRLRTEAIKFVTSAKYETIPFRSEERRVGKEGEPRMSREE